jgi:hypothetical protein
VKVFLGPQHAKKIATTLVSTISSGVFRKLLFEADVAAIFDALCKSGVVSVQGTRLAYQLPAD